MKRLDNSRWVQIGLSVLSLVVLLALWEWYGSDPLHFTTPPPSKVFPALWEALTTGGLLKDTAGTLLTVITGMVISIGIGIPLGFAIALFPWARNTLDPLIDAAYAMPVTMLIPIVGVYTGLDFRGRVFIVITYVLLVIVINTVTGIREVPRNLIDTGRAFGLEGMALWRHVTLPVAMAHIAPGISTGFARGVRAAVTAELLLIAADIGGFILNAQATLRMPQLLAGILWTLLLGYVLYTAALKFESRSLRWRTAGLGV